MQNVNTPLTSSTSNSALTTVILAAGKGTRMHSQRPKVLHCIGGVSLLQHVITTAKALQSTQTIVVYGHGKTQLEAVLAHEPVQTAYQAEQLGTGHAVQQALPMIDDAQNVLILYADTPLIQTETLTQLLAVKPENGIALLTVYLEDPTGYGRIVRDEQGHVLAIVEQKEATPEQQRINEVNTGIMIVNAKQLKQWLSQLSCDNAQNEFYLTDIIAMAQQSGCPIVTAHPQHIEEVEGVNNRLQLAHLERKYQQRQAEALLLAGVTLRDPARFDLRGTLTHGQDVIIDCNVIIEGHVTLGDRVEIGAGVILKNCHIGDDSVISPYSVIEGSTLDTQCTVGPFARLRPETHLAEKAHVGNFVELKKTTLGKESKAGHLTYLGDSTIGQRVNIGAGTITCNYDGANKWQTHIDDDVFVGSDTQLVAPVTIGQGATLAAGTTVTKDVAPNQLVLSRVRQQSLSNWQRPTKQNGKKEK